jgi:hypothetical protein
MAAAGTRFTSPVGKGRPEGPGEGVDNCHWQNPLTPTLFPPGRGS